MQGKEKRNSRQIVQQVLKNGITEYIPKGELCINEEAIKHILQVEQVGFGEKLQFTQTMNLDIYTLAPMHTCSASRLPDRSEYTWPDLQNWTSETAVFTFAVLDGAFEWGMRLFGVIEFCNMLRSRITIDDLIKQVEKLNNYMIEMLIGEGINGIILADDIAYQQGLFANPLVFTEFFIPSLARQAEKVFYTDLPVFYHSDGNYQLVLPDILKAGFTGLQCLEKTANMDIEQLQTAFDKEVCLWGHIDTEDLVAANDPLYLQTLVNKTKALAYKQKFILGTTSGIYEGMDLQTLQSLYHLL